MKTQQFQPPNSNLGQTIMQSVNMIRGKDVSNFTLLFIDATEKNKAGEHQSFFMPNIVIGRGSKCHVKYGDNYNTVSREHASITSANNQFFLNQNPSAKNPTFVNGSPIAGTMVLNNGDEIQFANNGPRLRFNTTQVKTSTIGFTSRIGSAIGQAVRPYKRAIILLGVLLLGSIGFGVFNLTKTIKQSKTIAMQELNLNQAQTELRNTKDITTRLTNQLNSEKAKGNSDAKKISELSQKISESNAREAGLMNRIRQVENRPVAQATQSAPSTQVNRTGAATNTTTNTAANRVQQGISTAGANSGAANQGTPNIGEAKPDSDYITTDNYPLREFEDDIYFIKVAGISVVVSGEYQANEAIDLYNTGWSGTGFLTKSGQFITARHVLEGWKWFQMQDCTTFDQPPVIMALNNYDMTGDVIVKYVATSPRGDVLRFTNKDVRVDLSEDITVCNNYKRTPWEAVYTDWATISFPSRAGISSIEINRNFSKSLAKGIPVEIAGYGRGIALQSSAEDLDPLYSKGTIAQDGLINKVINVTGMSTDSGHSGGPIFVKNKTTGKYEVIGLVHGKYGSIGRVVPIWYVE